MKRLWHQIRTAPGEHLPLVGLRWAAWLAGLGLILSSSPPPALLPGPIALAITTPLLLLLTITALLPRRWQSLLLLGLSEAIIASTMLAISGGWHSPLLIHALATLLLPYSLLPRRRRLLLAALASGLDLLGLLHSPPAFGALWESSASAVLLRLALPFALALIGTQQLPSLTPLPAAQLLAQALDAGVRRFRRISMLSGPGSSEREHATLLEIHMLADRGERDLRNTLSMLQAEEPDPTDLVARLREKAARFQQRTGIFCEVVIDGQQRQLPMVVEQTLLAVTGEALSNIERHAHAHSAEISVRYESSDIALAVRDNGVGLIGGSTERPGCHGLRALQYRVTELNGQLDIGEARSGGVELRVSVPLAVYAA